MKTLIVGFGPFASHEANPAADVLPRLTQEGVKTIVLPASYQKVHELPQILASEKPDAIITLNLSPFRKVPAIEQLAYNEMNSVQPDVDGVVMNGKPIVEGGPASIYSSLDIPSLQQYIASQGENVEISIDPGRFVCNQVSYLARYSGIPTVSLHVPLEKDYSLGELQELLEDVIQFLGFNL